MTTSRRSFFHVLLAVFAFSFVFTFAAQAGTIVGRVSDADKGGYLPGASVTLVGTGRVATTDGEGRFRFVDVPGGTATLRTSYLAYSDDIETVDVPDTGAVPVSVSMGENVLKLDQFVVAGYREGRSRALQQKKSASNIMDIVSADSVGNLPDQNVAEALSRLAGVNVDVSSGEGRFITIRGIEPNLNNVTFNGATLAAPGVNGREGRSMPLDVVAASQISQIEVIKSVTPDMDGNALGGTINIKTVSAFDRRDRFSYGALEFGDTRAADDGKIYGGDFTYGNLFGADKNFGVAFAASFSHRPYIKHDLQTNWSSFNGMPYPSSFEILPEDGERDRLGLNLNLEYRPNGDTSWWLRTIYNKFNEARTEDEIIMEARRDPVFVSPRSVTFNRMRYEIRAFSEETDQKLINVTAGGSKRMDNLTVEGDVTYSFAEEFNPEIKSAQFRTGNVNTPSLFSIDFNDFYPVIDDKGSMANSATVYPLRRFREEDSAVEETTYTPRLDFKWDMNNWLGGKKGFVKVGAKYTDRTRFVDDNSSRPVNSSLNIDTMNARGPARTVWDGRYTPGITVNMPAALSYLNANRSMFTIDPLESASNSIEDDYDIDETILAFYGMASVDVSDRFTVLGGFRYEKTDATVTAFELREQNGSFLGVFENKGQFDYGNVLPNVQFRFAMTDRAILRGAITKTIGRPAYEQAAPISVFEYTLDPAPINPAFPGDGDLEIGNPTLSPYVAVNFDLTLEYYLPSGGLVSAGMFVKSIDNPIYEYRDTLENTTYNGVGLEELRVQSLRNAESGKITGFEFNVQVPFSVFTKGFLGGFGVDANATFINSSATLIERDEAVPFFRQPDGIYNVALYYQMGGVSARAAWNYQTESIRLVGGSTESDRWQGDRYQFDVQASYAFNDKYTVFFKWKNVTDQPNELYIGNRAQMRNSEFYGSDIRAGMRFSF